MKKLPEIYKEVVNINNNRNIYYSKNEPFISSDNNPLKRRTTNNNSTSSNLKSIFSRGKYSYTKKVRIETIDKVYETRLVRRNNGKILTIDSDIINEKDITSLEIL